MNVLKSAFSEILHLFVDDGALALATLALIVVAIMAVKFVHVGGLVVAIVLLLGCICILAASLLRAARGAPKR
jgi:uncharacterized membrane protein